KKATHYEKTNIRTAHVIIVLFLMMFFLGSFLGLFDSTAVSFAEDLGDPGLASLVLMVASLFSMVMGFVFGMIRLPIPQYVQLILTSLCVGLGYGTMVFVDTTASLFICSIVGSIFYAPFLIVANTTCELAVPGDRLTEAITWMNAGMTCGMAFGPSAAGLIIDEVGTLASFDFGALLVIIVPIIALFSMRLLKRDIRIEHPNGADEQ
ncbi:MAG: MFS transporter, partial [Eggerthellaceae bacterium]|nr:MFS transporter [Eggerthellaceae bacterium]